MTAVPFSTTDLLQALGRLYWALDEFRYEEVVDCFAPDGVWERAGSVLHGRLAIRDMLEQRSRTQRVRHVVSNPLILASDDTAADTLHYITAYVHDTGEAPPAVPVLPGPTMVLVVTARFVRQDDAWLIAHQVTTRAFTFAAPSA